MELRPHERVLLHIEVRTLYARRMFDHSTTFLLYYTVPYYAMLDSTIYDILYYARHDHTKPYYINSNTNLTEFVLTHVILALGACGRGGSELRLMTPLPRDLRDPLDPRDPWTNSKLL